MVNVELFGVDIEVDYDGEGYDDYVDDYSYSYCWDLHVGQPSTVDIEYYLLSFDAFPYHLDDSYSSTFVDSYFVAVAVDIAVEIDDCVTVAVDIDVGPLCFYRWLVRESDGA